jgi:D-glycero-D-manno-heptose 1,7-bisphosphate phosphatase
MSNQVSLRAIFLDADGVLWKDIGPGGIFSGRRDAIQNLEFLSSNLAKAQLRIVVSNQTFAARKKMSYFKFKTYTKSFFNSLIKLGLLDDFAICYHHPNAQNILLRKKCECRKPLPGLLNFMARKHNINLRKSALIGDRVTDIQSGAAVGIDHLYLIVNDRMLEININSSQQSLYQIFMPLKDLKEFTLLKEFINEN